MRYQFEQTTHPSNISPQPSTGARRDGRLSVVIERVTNPPSKTDIFVLVRVGQSEQVTPWSASSAWRSTEENVKLMRSTMHFDLPRSNVQDRSTQIVLEVHDANGLHSSVSLPVWKVARGDDTHGNFPSMFPPLPEFNPGCIFMGRVA